MMKTILFILFVLISFVGKAQTNLDSLWNVWEDEQENNTERVEALLGYNKVKYIDSNSDSAFVLLDLAKKFSKDCKNCIAKCNLQEGEFYFKKKEFKQAKASFKKVISAYELANDYKKMVGTYYKLAVLFIVNKMFEEALVYVEKGEKISKELNYKTGIAKALFLYGNANAVYNKKKAIEFYKESLALAKNNHDSTIISDVTMNLGITNVKIGKYEEAIICFKECISINEKMREDILAAKACNNLGGVYADKGDFKKAISCYNKCSRIYSEIDENHFMVAAMILNIGRIYERMEDYEKAMENYKICLEVALKSEVKRLILVSYFNIGGVYHSLDNFYEAISFYNKAIKIGEEIKALNYLPRLYENLGAALMDIYVKNEAKGIGNETLELSENKTIISKVKLFERAEEVLKKGLKIAKETGNVENEARIDIVLGKLYGLNGEYQNKKKSLNYAVNAYELAKDGAIFSLISSSAELLYEKYKSQNESEKALEMYTIYISCRDSLQNKDNQKLLIQHEYRSQYEKQAATDSIEHLKAQKIKEVQIAKQEVELKSKRNQQYALFGGLGLVVLFALFMLKKNKQIQQQKKEIEIQKNFAEEQQQFAENQKEELSHQHDQIRDSIDYAQTLQKAVLPSFEDVTNNFANNFVYFQPKDVVSGDFFWTFSKNEIKYLAVVDCTGHGVPGAFMTIVANNLLNEIVLENYSTPKEIIEELHKRIKVRVGGHKDAKVRDSMDLGLLSYDAKAKKVNFVGTHASLYLVRNNKLQKIKGSKADIGYSDEIKVEEHVVDVQKNDMLYFHSDGFPDQKGGPKGKKFYYQPIRNKFEEICLLNLEEQKSILQKTFNDWKGDNEQLDDVCMIGIRI